MQMSKKKQAVIISTSLLMIVILCVTSLSFGVPWVKAAQPKEKEYLFDMKPLYGTESSRLLQNPDRGLRMEVYLDVKTGKSLFEHADEDAIEQLHDEIERYKSDKPTLVQVYFYLTGYKDQPLDQAAFDRMNDYFNELEKYNLKALLRFAYIWDDTNPVAQEPSNEQVVKHMEQLKPFLEERQDQITVYQAGIIGAWGEWDSGARSRVDEKMIFDAILDNTPKDMFIQVRYLNIKNKNIDPKDTYNWNRVGFHDDFLIGVYHGWNTAGSNPSSNEWKQMTEESANLLVDGEMIWGSANGSYTGGKSIDAFLMAKRLQEHHFTSLSLTHNYIEKDGMFSMYDWKKQYINQNILDKNGLRYDPNWFKDSKGKNISRNMYEYIRDYLGYYLVVNEGKATVKGEQMDVSIILNNYGFAAPVGLASIDVALIDADGKTITVKPACELASLQPAKPQEIETTFTLPDSKRGYTIGLLIKGKDETSVRLANNVPFVNGINIIGQINPKK